jgi:poly-beta-1,6-N-acetyl-D-glucosamine synthase
MTQFINNHRYVLLTAAKDEAGYIGEAIASVVKQSILPLAWFIMDDGSTDHTAKIVADFARRYPFIRFSSAENRLGRNFGSQYKALKAAYEMARELDFELAAVQDADIAHERTDYYESIIKKFERNPRLGIAGGYIHERANGRWVCRKGNSKDSVAGGIQMFRRTCFEQIGGYTPLRLGGSDWLAQIDALMAGWEVLALPDLPVRHYRPTSTANGRWRGLFQLGLLDASFGSHPFFELFKCGRRLKNSPVIIAGIVRLAGYLWWKGLGRPPVISPEKVSFLRGYQMAKLSERLRRLPRVGGSMQGKDTAARAPRASHQG